MVKGKYGLKRPTKKSYKTKSYKTEVSWECHDCKKIIKTEHSNIPRRCVCGCKYFKWIKRRKVLKC